MNGSALTASSQEHERRADAAELTEAVDQLVRSGDPSLSHARVLASIVSRQVPDPENAPAEISPARAFAHLTGGGSTLETRSLGEAFEVVAGPGERHGELSAGDVVIQCPPGEGYAASVSVLLDGEAVPGVEAARQGARLVGTGPGTYYRVVEGGRAPKSADEGALRKVGRSSAYLDHDQVVVRPRHRALTVSTEQQAQAHIRKNPVDAVCPKQRGKIYFFRGDQCILYDLGNRRPDPGYPRAITTEFAGQGGLGANGIDAALRLANGRFYLFKGSECALYSSRRRLEQGYPRAITADWPGLWAQDLDAAFRSGRSAFFSKGNQYTWYNIPGGRQVGGFPRVLPDRWRGLPWTRDLSATLRLGNAVLFFKGDDVARFLANPCYRRVLRGYPRFIEDEFPGSTAGMVTLTGARRRVAEQAETELARWRTAAGAVIRENAAAGQAILLNYWPAAGTANPAAAFGANWWTNPWSAAFVSFCVQQAAAALNLGPLFQGASSHMRYTWQAHRDRTNNVRERYWAFQPANAVIEVGDIIVKGRGNVQATWANVTANNLVFRPTHGDIVVAVRNRHADIIGGNVGDSVRKGCYLLRQNGRVDTTSQSARRVFGVLKLIGPP